MVMVKRMQLYQSIISIPLVMATVMVMVMAMVTEMGEDLPTARLLTLTRDGEGGLSILSESDFLYLISDYIIGDVNSDGRDDLVVTSASDIIGPAVILICQ